MRTKPWALARLLSLRPAAGEATKHEAGSCFAAKHEAASCFAKQRLEGRGTLLRLAKTAPSPIFSLRLARARRRRRALASRRSLHTK